MKPINLVIICFLQCVIYSSSSHAQIEIPEGARVGLVLSGGGARGLAHIGVIKILEQHGIQADIVTGTSMGSIIGALYATGLSAEEIENAALNMNWRDALSDATPRREQPYPFRQLEAGMTTDLRLSISRKGFGFPKGVIQGQHLGQVLADLFKDRGQPMQFENLPIQFAAVAADLETGEAVIMDQGDVASAVRASMSIPGAIAPTLRNERLLVDGGIANNMPVDLARKMGADVIIAVDVSSPLLERDNLNSIFSIANQTTAFLVRLNTVAQRENLTDSDVLILPELGHFGATAFDQAEPIITAGVDAAIASLGPVPVGKPFHVTDQANTSAKPVSQESGIDAFDTEPLTFIRVSNNSSISDRVIRASLRQKTGQPLNKLQLEEDISRLYGLDYFSLVHYQVLREDGQLGLEVVCLARDTGDSWLKVGMEVAEDFRGNSEFGLAVSLRSAGLNQFGGTAFNRIELGSTLAFESRFLQPLDSRLRYFVEPSFGYIASPFDLYLEGDARHPISSYQKADSWVSLALGRMLWQEVAELRFGVTRQRGHLNFQGGVDIGIDNENYDDGFYFATAGWDSLDDLGFPSEGTRWSLTHESHQAKLSAEANFSRTLADFTHAIGNGRSTLLLEADAQFSSSDEAGFVDVPFIGGFLELSGLPPRSRFGRHRVLIRSVFLHRLNSQGPLPIGVPIYFGISLEKGNVWLNKKEIDWNNAIGAGSIFIGARTLLGPAFLSLGATDTGEKSISIFLGQRFR